MVKSHANVFTTAKTTSFDGDYNAAKNQLTALLDKTITQNLIADVETGVFLSGGIDSSLVTAFASKHHENLKTFSIGFDEKEYDESDLAKQIASHLGTDHHCHIITQDDAAKYIPKLIETFDEPFADISALAGLALTDFANNHVKVALSGDGGDEGFMGYNRYIWSRKKALQNTNIARLAKILPLDKLPFLPNQMDEKIEKFRKMIKAVTAEDKYFSLLEKWSERLTEDYPHEYHLGGNTHDLAESFNTYDLDFYLPGDVLTKVDRTSMAYGFEVRVPLLDHSVVEFGRSLPTHFKIKNRTGKTILRDILSDQLPQNILNAPKSGFAVPIGKWMTTSLKEQASTYFSKENLEDAGINPKPVLKQWHLLQKGQYAHQHRLWTIMMWMMWKDRYL